MSVTAEADPGTVPETTPEPVEAPVPPQEPETTPEPTQEPEGPQEPVEPPSQGMSEKQLNAAFDKLAKEGKRHRDRLDEIMGEDALALVECPLCSPEMAGWRFPVEPDDDTKELIRAMIGDATTAELQPANFANECPDCQGYGLVVSGSLVPEKRAINCRRCNGWGYVQVDGPQATTALSNVTPMVAPSDQPPGNEPPDTDFMGRKRGDPNFGVLAGYER